MTGKFARVVSMATLSVLAAWSATAQAAVTIDYYSDFTDTGSGITVAGTPYATGTTSAYALGDLQSDAAINTVANWQPASAAFAAVLTSVVDTAGTYTLSMTSDDASYLFVNGVLVLSNGGDHSEQTVTGTYTFKVGDIAVVEYDNTMCCGSGLQVTATPANAVPEPASWALMLLGVGGVGYALRRGRREASALMA